MPETETNHSLGRLHQFLDRRVYPYLPYPHFMWLAPLDVVLRLLYWPLAWIPLIYWPRAAVLLAFSAFATIVSIPERLALAILLRLRPLRFEEHRAPVFVLGYFRSGTTYLQSLLAADPMLRSPRWGEVLFPQSFIIGWTVFRYLLIPFLPLARVEQVSPMAPTLPGEDDFALNNWALMSVIAGRAVLPSAQPYYDRYNDLDSLSPIEFARWQRYQRCFVEKIALISRGRRLVLKSPSHTARVRYLLALFPGAKFIHISRPPLAVFQSNLFLAHTLQRRFGLQHPLPAEEQEEIIASEYLATEQHYLSDRALIPAGSLAEIRLQDLSADPIGQLRRVYSECGLPFSEAYEQRLSTLIGTSDQRPANVHSQLTDQQRTIVGRLQPLVAAFGHDQPPMPKVSVVVPDARPPNFLLGAVRGIVLTLVCVAIWNGIDYLIGGQNAILVWPSSVAIGYAVLGSEGVRSNGMGLLSGALALTSLAMLLGVSALSHGSPLDASLIAPVVRPIVRIDGIFLAAVGSFTAFWIGSGRPA